MDTDLIQILLIEDDRGDVLLLKESLAEATSIRTKLTHADRLSVGLKQITEQAFDLILLDLNLPDSFGLETLNNLQRQAPNIPVVVLSGLADDTITIEAIRHGAQDFLVKGEISGPMLGRVLRYAIERKQAELKLQESEVRYRSLFENMLSGYAHCQMIFEQDKPQDFIYIDVNAAFEKLTGLKDIVGKRVSDVIPGIQESNPELFDIYGRVAQTGNPETLETYVPSLDIWFYISVYSPKQGYFVAVFDNITERKRAEEALRENEERYRIIFGLTNDYAYKNRIEPDGRIVPEWITEGVTRITGYTLADAQSPDFFAKLVHPADIPILIQHTQQMLSGQIDTAEARILTKSGELRWLLNSAYPISDVAQGRVVAMYGTAQDITERKRAEQALHESEEHYRRIIETAHEGVWTIDADNRTTLVNQRLADMLGYTIEEILSKTIYDFTDEEGKAIGAKSLENRRQGINEQFDFKFIHKDGATVWVILETNALLDHEGNYAGALAMLTDITERRRADDALKLVYSQLANLYNNLPQAIFSIDMVQNKMLQASPAHEAVFGYPLDAFFKNPQLWYEIILPEDKPIVDANYQVLFAGQVVQQQFRILRPDGETPWLEAIIKPIIDDSGKPVRLDGIVSDITERKQAEERIRRQLARLTALSEIDRAISSSFDLQFSLDAVLVHVIAQLGVDAADVLLYDANTQMLQYAAGQGFRSQAIEKAAISLSRGHAAHAVLNRRPVCISDLNIEPEDSPRSVLFKNEGFVSYYAVPLFAKGELNGVLGIFHRSCLEPEREWLNFLNTLAGQCAIAIDNATLFSGLQRSNIELSLAYDATIVGWSHALDLRDKETEGHSQRVTEMTLRLAQAMGISKEEQVQIRRGALLHDIGKMGIPDGILLKPGSLTNDEWFIMKKHPGLAFEMLSPIAYLKPALDIPYCHHEKWDGTGYPRGLKGEQIPLAARIFAIVDVWDALRSDRPYRAAWPVEKVREHIRALSGTHFDPQVVTVFLESDVMRLT